MKKFDNILQGALKAHHSIGVDSIIDKIVIRDEFKELIPPLSDDELQQLEQNILSEGVRDPIIVWAQEGSFILIDGHNRYSICKKHGLDFPYKKIPFADSDEAKTWMLTNQLGRRNLSPSQQSYLRGLRYIQEKSQGKRSDLTSGQNVQKSDPESTAERLAKEYSVSDKTIIRDGDFAKGIERIGEKAPHVKKEILKGKSKLRKQDIQSVGKAKKEVSDLFHVDQKKDKKPKGKITPQSVAEIAFSFIGNEKRSIDEICSALRIEHPVEPIDFFIKWQVARNSITKATESNN